jgi:hypothetical protein
MTGFGADWTGNVFRQWICFSECKPVGGRTDANTNSKLPVYLVFSIAFGIILLQTARQIDPFAYYIPFLAELFFCGGGPVFHRFW